MGLLAGLRKVQNALHECAESIRRAEQCKRNQEMMRTQPSKPLDVRAVVSYDQKTVTDAATQDERSHTTQESIKNATWAAFYAVAAYAVITTFMWLSMIEQNRIGRVSLNQSQMQWNEQQRPWVGPQGNVEIPKTPIFQVFSATPDDTAIDLAVTVKIKNVGLSPAFEASWDIQPHLSGNDLTLPQLPMKMACVSAEGKSNDGNGNLILPGGEMGIEAGSETVMAQQIKLSNVRRVWIVGCIVYKDRAKQLIHHTKFWIMSSMIPENATPIVVKPNKLFTSFTLPIPGYGMVRSEAD